VIEKKVIYPFEEHLLDHGSIDLHALYILEKLQKAGFTAYLVGGSVRDLLLKRKPKDFDISTSARPEQIKALFPNCILIGRRFLLAHIRFGKKVFEVSTFRSGELNSEELIVRDNEWGTEEEDVLRRDFTINGLFYDAATQSLIDYIGGYEDLKKRYLRTIGAPFLRFKQDPVRMIRLLKFQARFSLEVDPLARIALLECKHDITKSSSVRVLEELLRMLESTASSTFIQLLLEHGLLQLMLPLFGEFLESNLGKEVFSYLQEIDRIFAENSYPLDRSLLLTALAFPLFHERIQNGLLLSHRKSFHLGEIHAKAIEFVTEFFQPFFHIPRRFKTHVVSILTGQYRLTPLEKKRSSRLRVPQDPDFHLSIHFLYLRSRLQPALQTVFEQWQHATASLPQPILKKKSRRRRKRPPSP
jgi:poly(A) polymerase